jgi:prepilin-type N-terminal cleavage/methylation domain-containing protein
MKRARASQSTRGFTLIEVLVALLFMAILLPAIMQGITLASRLGHAAQRRTEAAQLGESQLSQIALSITTAQAQGGTSSGDFGPNAPGYQWESTVQSWPLDTTSAGIQEIDLTVTWTDGGQSQSLQLSTLAYPRGQG